MMHSSPPLPHPAPGVPSRLKACVLALAALFAAPALANPAGGAVAAGQAAIVRQGNLMTVTNSNGAIINWQSFSIGRDETTRFVQPSSSASVLNRVVGADPSSILGRLESNGRVFLVNPAGIMVGAGARIDVAGFVASSLNLRNEDFLANRLDFAATPGAGLVRNDGIITTSQGGKVFLVAPKVANAGAIAAPGGEVALAAGRTVQIGDTAAPGVRIEVAGGESAQNIGTIAAEAGRIGLFGALVGNSGRLNASSAVAEGGRIVLRATGDTTVDGDASITATGTRGGRVEVLGNRVGIDGRSVIDASGGSAGGTVLVGGGFQGGDAAIPNARVTWVGPQATLRADAGGTGDGGKVVIWADDATRAHGMVSARGGPDGGAGGLIETSGKRYLDVEGIRVSAAAPNGAAGTWLIDPDELRIVNNGSPGTDLSVTVGPNFAPSATLPAPTLSTDTLNTAINSGATSVNITTGSGGGGTGDITFDAGSAPVLITKNAAGAATSLNVNAYRNIMFSGGVTTFRTQGAGSASLDVNLNAGAGNNTGAANVFTADAATTVNLSGTPTAAVTATVGNGKTWINNGTVNLTGMSTINLPVGFNQFPAPPLASTPANLPATFQNAGTLNNGSTAAKFFTSNANRDGVVDNFGTFNSVGGTLEAAFNNQPGSTLNLLGGNNLALANAQLMRGNINIPNALGVLQLTEYHGTVARFHDTVAGGAGSILVQGAGSPQADFQRFSGSGLTLKSGTGGAVSVTSGISVFGDVVFGGGTVDVNGGTLAVAGPFSIPVSGMTFGGNAGVAAGGDLLLGGGSVSGATNIALASGATLRITGASVDASGTVFLGAANAVVIDNANIGVPGGSGTNISSGGAIQLLNGSSVGNGSVPTNLSAGFVGINNATARGSVTTVTANDLLVAGGSIIGTDRVRAQVVRDIRLASLTGNSAIGGVNAVNLVLASPDSTLDLAGSASGASVIGVNGPAGSAIRILFSTRASGGIMVDGAPAIGPGRFGSGFQAGRAQAVVDGNLFIAYGGIASDVCRTLPGLCVVKLIGTLPVGGAIGPRPAAKDDAEGIGAFGEAPAGATGTVPGSGPQRKRPGVCKAA